MDVKGEVLLQFFTCSKTRLTEKGISANSSPKPNPKPNPNPNFLYLLREDMN